LAASAVTLLAVMALNAYIDPLWYFGGNRFSGMNYAFNDRLSKLNVFLQSSGKYDCLIFGASSTATVDGDLIKGHRCFNFSFRAGNVHEYVDYAEYLAWLGYRPALVIVGVDLYNLQIENMPDDSPEEVRNFEPPPSVIKKIARQLSLR